MVDAFTPVTDTRPSQSYGRRVIKRFVKHKPAVVGMALLTIMAVVVVIGPYVSPYTYDGQDFELLGQPGPMAAQHWLGNGELDRDSFARLIHGGRVSLVVGLAGAVIATLVGTLIGALAGFYRGWVDTILMRFTNVMLSILTLPLVLLLSGLFRPGPVRLVGTVGTLIWMGTARLVRSQFLALREREFVEAARALGAGGIRLMFVHILPNAIGPITVAAMLAVGSAIMLESALSFLGFGIQPPVPTWGNLLNHASAWLSVSPVLAIAPGFCILVTVLAVNFAGDGLRDAMEPRE